MDKRRMVRRGMAVLVGVVWCALLALRAYAAEPAKKVEPTPVKFVMSAEEAKDLEMLKLRGKLLQTEKDLADAQAKLAYLQHVYDITKFVQTTLKQHGEPKGVTFDPNTMSWVVK